MATSTSTGWTRHEHSEQGGLVESRKTLLPTAGVLCIKQGVAGGRHMGQVQTLQQKWSYGVICKNAALFSQHAAASLYIL